MRPRLNLAALREFSLLEDAVRFLFGGIVTVMAGLVARAYGPETGGLFLAFPAILPASLTLIARHKGRRQAADEAHGAVLGAVALVGFAASLRWIGARTPAPVSLGLAAATWLVAALLLWVLSHRLRRHA